MTTRVRPHTIGQSPTTSTPWLHRLGVFVLVAGALSIVGMLAIKQTSRKRGPPIVKSVFASIQPSESSAGNVTRIETWKAAILAPSNLHETIVDLHLDQGLLPHGEKFSSPAQWEPKVLEQLQVEAVRDRRHADDLIRISYPVGRNASEAVALVNTLAERAVAGREAAARQLAEQANQEVIAMRASTAAAALRLQQLQAEFAKSRKSAIAPPPEDKNSVAVVTFFAERRARLSQDLAEFQRRRDVLLETLMPAHPEIRDLDLKIENVQTALNQIPPPEAPAENAPNPPGTDALARSNDGKLSEAIIVAWTDWERLMAEQSKAEQQWLALGKLPTFVLTQALVPVVQLSSDKPSTAVLSFVVLAAIAGGIAAAGWIRKEPVVLKTARDVENSLHLKVLAVLPSGGVKI